MLSNNHPRRLLLSLWLLGSALALPAATFELAPAKDARILGMQGFETANFATDILSVYTFADNVQRSLLEFDLDQITLEPGTRVSAANLTLHASLGFGGSNGKPMFIHAVNRPWSETGLTWQRADHTANWTTAGGDFVGSDGRPHGTPFAVSTAAPTDGGPVTWDVRELVDRWIEGVAQNHGMLLSSTEGNGLTFHQRESLFTGFRPRLQVVTEPGPPRLRMAPESATGNLVLSWRGVGTAVLQERPLTGTHSDWIDSQLPVTTANDRSTVTVTPTAARFYRLRSN
jgi:hypothetical protein